MASIFQRKKGGAWWIKYYVKTRRYRRGYAKPLLLGQQPYLLPVIVEGKGILIIDRKPRT
jgi:hypothetical protein